MTIGQQGQHAPGDAELGLDDFPILGEPLTIEFANTLYRSADGSTTDYLDSHSSVAGWFSAAPAAQQTTLPTPIPESLVVELHRLRGAVIRLLDAKVDGQPIDGASVAVVNEFAARAPGHLELSWSGDERSAKFRHGGRSADIFLAELGGSVVAFLGGPDLESVRRCERPGCFMLFVRQHHKRRFCYEGCSHRMRQARYYRSTVISAPQLSKK